MSKGIRISGTMSAKREVDLNNRIAIPALMLKSIGISKSDGTVDVSCDGDTITIRKDVEPPSD